MHSSRPPRGGSSPAALPALLRATHLLGLALGSALDRLRESGATAARLFVRAEENALLLRMTRDAAGILGARWDKVPERQRPHYAPEQRFRILRIRSFLCLSQRETAEMFRVSPETIARWEMETTSTDGEAPRCRGAMGIAGGLWRAKTSTRRLRISRRSRLPATGRAKARWICPFASSTSTRSGFCQCWFEKQPERAITELGE